jgi:hypothetical protein
MVYPRERPAAYDDVMIAALKPYLLQRPGPEVAVALGGVTASLGKAIAIAVRGRPEP